MFIQRIASSLVFLSGLVLLRFAVVAESWPALVGGLAVAAGGLAWLVLGGMPPSTQATLGSPDA